MDRASDVLSINQIKMMTDCFLQKPSTGRYFKQSTFCPSKKIILCQRLVFYPSKRNIFSRMYCILLSKGNTTWSGRNSSRHIEVKWPQIELLLFYSIVTNIVTPKQQVMSVSGGTNVQHNADNFPSATI